MIRYRCEKCGADLESPVSMAGKTDTCPACKQVSLVPPHRRARSGLFIFAGAIGCIILGIAGTLLLCGEWKHFSSKASQTPVVTNPGNPNPSVVDLGLASPQVVTKTHGGNRAHKVMDTVMVASEFRACGLQKLSDEELGRLDAFFLKAMLAVAPDQGTGAPSAVAARPEKSPPVPVVLVEPGVGGFEPIVGSSVGNTWKKGDVKPVILVEPGGGGFRPASGWSMGNSWTKDDVLAITLVGPTALGAPPAGFVPVEVIEARIDGEFKGWDGETIFKLDNGQIWQQARYAYTYNYAFQPKVIIIKSDGDCKMKVDGVSETISVKRLK